MRGPGDQGAPPFGDRLRGPLRQEMRLDATDQAVIGGFGVFAARELAALGEAGFSSEFGTYARLDRDARRALLARLDSFLRGEKAFPGATAVPPAAAPSSPGKRSQAAGPGPLPEPGPSFSGGSPLSALPGLGRAQQMAFAKLGLKTVDDFLLRPPAFVLHRGALTPLGSLAPGKPVLVAGLVGAVELNRRGKLSTLKVRLEDGTGRLSLVFFNMPYMKDRIHQGQPMAAAGRADSAKGGWRMQAGAAAVAFLSAEEWERIQGGGLVLRYHSTPSLSQDFQEGLLGRILPSYLGQLGGSDLPAPPGLPGRAEALTLLHRALSPEEHERGRRRLAFDELVVLQAFLGMRKRARARLRKDRRYRTEGPLLSRFWKALPFAMTEAQKRVCAEIFDDLRSPKPMNRLLQGDVGSGKTVVAASAMVAAVESGYQAALMAPTEILAVQHERTFRRLLEGTGLRVLRLTGGLSAGEARLHRALIRSGEAQVIVGTHALIEPGTDFRALGLAVVDERHKFGVSQREALESKAELPDALMMTATPFPRALVLTLYGDTELSVLDEVPLGRGGVPTRWAGMSRRDEVYADLRREVEDGGRAYVVFPLVESSSKLAARAATREIEELGRGPLAGLSLGLIHGRMSPAEKDEAMKAFRDGSVQVLVSTTVVEVGLDVPEASVMVVENAERFGLSQLHQLRGRVGRGSRPSRCWLVTGPRVSGEAVERIRAMVRIQDGFRLSEEDLRLRGPGELLGSRQHGMGFSAIVDLARDTDLLEKARDLAGNILDGDPELKGPEQAGLRALMDRGYHGELRKARFS